MYGSQRFIIPGCHTSMPYKIYFFWAYEFLLFKSTLLHSTREDKGLKFGNEERIMQGLVDPKPVSTYRDS